MDDKKLASGTGVAGRPGDSAVQGAIRLLAHHVGPFARIVAKQSLTKLSATTDGLTQQQFGMVIQMMAEKLPDAAAKDKFYREAMALGKDLAR